MRKGEEEGDALCELARSLYSSSNRPTSLRSEKNPRTIDWLFTNAEQQHIELLDFEYRLSDHRPVASKVLLRSSAHKGRIPNKDSARCYLEKCMEMEAAMSIERFNDVVKEEIRAGRRPYKNIKSKDSR